MQKVNAFSTKYKGNNNLLAFKGYAAAPIKALYMQADNNKTPDSGNRANINIFSELKRTLAGKNIDIKIQIGKKGIYNSPEDINQNKFLNKNKSDCTIWSQDNKVFLESKDDNKVQLMKLMKYIKSKKLIDGKYPSYLAKAEGFKEKNMPYFMHLVEGGNFFIGRRSDNSKYLLIGEQSINFLLNNLIENLTKSPNSSNTEIERFNKKLKAIDPHIKGNIDINFIEDLERCTDPERTDKSGNFICKIQDNNIQNLSAKEIKARAVIEGIKDLLSDTFGVDDVTILPQQQFHLDLFLRPLNNNIILASDPGKSIEVLDNLKSDIKEKLPPELKDKKASELNDLIEKYSEKPDNEKSYEERKNMLFADLVLFINGLKKDTKLYIKDRKRAFKNVINVLNLKGFNVIKVFGEIGNTLMETYPSFLEESSFKNLSEAKYDSSPPLFSCQLLDSHDSEDLYLPYPGHYFNYLNAIVHQKEDKSMAYITNRVDMPFSPLSHTYNMQEFLQDNGIKNLDERFQEELGEKLKNFSDSKISDFYFISGGKINNSETVIGSILSEKEGGIHCMVNELPDFQKWKELNRQT